MIVIISDKIFELITFKLRGLKRIFRVANVHDF